MLARKNTEPWSTSFIKKKEFLGNEVETKNKMIYKTGRYTRVKKQLLNQSSLTPKGVYAYVYNRG